MVASPSARLRARLEFGAVCQDRAGRNRWCVVEVFAGISGRAATGSPQPPPGGGLLLYVVSPSARLRADPELGSVRRDRAGRSLGAAEARSSLTSRALRRLQPACHSEFGILNAEFAASTKPQRAAASPREDPLFASAFAFARTRPSQAAARVRFVVFLSIASAIGRPQPPGGGGPQFLAFVCVLRRLHTNT